jgi:hypothetical protein
VSKFTPKKFYEIDLRYHGQLLEQLSLRKDGSGLEPTSAAAISKNAVSWVLDLRTESLTCLGIGIK